MKALDEMVLTEKPFVLMVDDDLGLLDMAGEVLKSDYAVSFAASGPEALELIRGGFIPAIILLDIDMPEKSGMHLLSEIKSLDGGIQVIMLTDLVNITTVLEALRCGAEACLFKPFGQDNQLMDAVTDCFRKIDRWWGSFRDLTQRRQVSLAGGRVETLL